MRPRWMGHRQAKTDAGILRCAQNDNSKGRARGQNDKRMSLLRGRGWRRALGEHEGEVDDVVGRIGADVDAGPVALAEKVGVFLEEVAEVGGVEDVAGFHAEVRGEGLLLVWRETRPLDGLDVVLRTRIDREAV